MVQKTIHFTLGAPCSTPGWMACLSLLSRPSFSQHRSEHITSTKCCLAFKAFIIRHLLPFLVPYTFSAPVCNVPFPTSMPLNSMAASCLQHSPFSHLWESNPTLSEKPGLVLVPPSSRAAYQLSHPFNWDEGSGRVYPFLPSTDSAWSPAHKCLLSACLPTSSLFQFCPQDSWLSARLSSLHGPSSPVPATSGQPSHEASLQPLQPPSRGSLPCILPLGGLRHRVSVSGQWPGSSTVEWDPKSACPKGEN